MLITETYRELNRELHERVQTYGTGAWRWAPFVADLADRIGTREVLDYGAGRRTLKPALLELGDFDVREYDPAVEEIAELPGPADLVCCLDVMEHVEEECLDDVLSHLQSLAKIAVLFSVACRVSGKRLADGRPAHVLVRSPDWWTRKIRQYGRLEKFEAAPKTMNGILWTP